VVTSIVVFLLSAPGAFLVASRRMDFRRAGFWCILTASLLQAHLMLVAGMTWLALSSCVFAVSAILGLANNWTWRRQ